MYVLCSSERVSKTGVNGVLLTEAKYINLSLHYLEQVSCYLLIGRTFIVTVLQLVGLYYSLTVWPGDCGVEWEKSTAHSISQLHDDVGTERQSRRQLYDVNDSHVLCWQTQHWRQLISSLVTCFWLISLYQSRFWMHLCDVSRKRCQHVGLHNALRWSRTTCRSTRSSIRNF